MSSFRAIQKHFAYVTQQCQKSHNALLKLQAAQVQPNAELEAAIAEVGRAVLTSTALPRMLNRILKRKFQTLIINPEDQLRVGFENLQQFDAFRLAG